MLKCAHSQKIYLQQILQKSWLQQLRLQLRFYDQQSIFNFKLNTEVPSPWILQHKRHSHICRQNIVLAADAEERALAVSVAIQKRRRRRKMGRRTRGRRLAAPVVEDGEGPGRRRGSGGGRGRSYRGKRRPVRRGLWRWWRKGRRGQPSGGARNAAGMSHPWYDCDSEHSQSAVYRWTVAVLWSAYFSLKGCVKLAPAARWSHVEGFTQTFRKKSALLNIKDRKQKKCRFWMNTENLLRCVRVWKLLWTGWCWSTWLAY